LSIFELHKKVCFPPSESVGFAWLNFSSCTS
jgi:hypothetical protein